MVLFRFLRGELDQIRCASRRHFLGCRRSSMHPTHFLELVPRSLIRIELQGLARMDLLPEQAAFGIPAEHRDVNPDGLIIWIEHDDTSLQSGSLAHIAPLKALLE